jgi:hypothetical protein
MKKYTNKILIIVTIAMVLALTVYFFIGVSEIKKQINTELIINH